MGLSEWINGLFKGKKAENGQNWLRDTSILSGYTLSEDGWLERASGKDVYASDVVLNAMDRVATEASKIEVRSVVNKPNEVLVQNDDITRLFRFGPNPLQTATDFLSAVMWIRMKYNNVFIYPQYEIVKDAYGYSTKRYTAFWVLKPVDFEVGTDTSGNVWEIKFHYSDGNDYILPYSSLLHLKWRRGVNLFKCGGDDEGRPRTEDMLHSVAALNATIEGLPKAIASSLQVKGVYNAKSLLDSSRQAEQRQNFEHHIIDSKLGMVVTDLAGEFTPVNMMQPTISENLAAFMRSGVTQRYGVSDAVLNGDYTSAQHSAFFHTTIEGFMADFSQEFSRKLFTPREQDIGHRVKCYYNSLQYMGVTEKEEMAKLAFNVGLMSINEVREMWGMTPIPNGERYLQSLNYVDTGIVNQYQLDRVNDGASASIDTKGGSNDNQQGEPGTADDAAGDSAERSRTE